MSESIINYYTQIPKEYLSDSNYYNPNAKDGMPLQEVGITIARLCSYHNHISPFQNKLD